MMKIINDNNLLKLLMKIVREVDILIFVILLVSKNKRKY